jgi:hypothetical protein
VTQELNTARPSSKAAWLRFRSWVSRYLTLLADRSHVQCLALYNLETYAQIVREGLKALDADSPPAQMVLSYRLAATFGDDPL